MFSGIIKYLFKVAALQLKTNLLTFSIECTDEFLEGLAVGASVAVDGVCLTVAGIEKSEVFFDVVSETIKKTTLKDLYVGRVLGVERSLKVGDEIGGHLLSGHVWGTAEIQAIQTGENEHIATLICPKDGIKYILPKGFVALDGASLTAASVIENKFTVHLIPETIKRTALGAKKAGDLVNLEIDSRTQAVVDTVERIHQMV